MKGCFCYLVNHSDVGDNGKICRDNIGDCCRSLSLLNENYLKQFPTTVIIFHESGLSEQSKQRLIESSKAPLTFVLVVFKVPSFINEREINNGWRLGYKHMCRFFANEIFYQPILDYFDYYCRIDTDSYWLSPVTSNIFDDAEKNNAMYGFVNDSMYDAPDCAEGLWNAARKFINEHQDLEVYNRMSDIPELRYYSVNFELAYIPWFKQDPWRLFFNAIDKEGGIYKHRWGDHCIRYIGLKLFMHPDNIKRITNIHYRHQNEHYNPR